MLINAGTLAPRVANWPPKFDISFFQPWGQYKAINSTFTSNLGQIEKFFSISALTPSVKPWG
jgi:hypothetical protein